MTNCVKPRGLKSDGDLNDCQSGIYAFVNCINSPVTGNGMQACLIADDTHILQIATAETDSFAIAYYRTKWNNIWTTWKKVTLT